jgi:hypothetical protein
MKQMPGQWRGLLALAILVVFIMLIGSCSQREQQLQWEKLAQYEQGDTAPSPDEQPRLTVVTTPEQVSELQGYVYSTVLQQVSETDFSTYLILAVFHGYRGASNYSIEVEEIGQKDRTIIVYAKFLDPDPKEPTVEITSSPYYVLRVKKSTDLHGEFTFVLMADDKEIERETVIIP